ncbi:MAG: general secretion pathway protein GspB [Candidatus Azotimanducaceae bacterium]
MTFILRAQNKSQGVNLESSSARIKTRHIFIGAILVCSFALTAGLLIFNESQITPADQQKTVIENPQKTTKPDISKNSTEFNLELRNIQAESNRLSSVDQNEVLLSDLTQKVTSHIYTQNPTDRSVFIEGIAYQIGDRYESIEIRDITEQGITIRMTKSGPESTDLTLSLVENWLEN